MHRLLLLLATQASCIAVSARAHVGAAGDERETGVQAGITLGIGVATSSRSAVVVTPGVVTGAPRLGLADGIEYVRAGRGDDSWFAWRAGAGGTIAVIGEPTLLGPHAAGLVVLRDRGRSWAGHEKMGGGGSARSLLGVGVETRVGLSVREADGEKRRAFGYSAALTLEWIHLSRWKCC